MIFPGVPFYRLTPRGGGGLACDEAGVALGPADLVRVRADAAGRRRCEVQAPGELGRILGAAYGPQPEAVVLCLHRGLQRAAAAIEAGNLCLAGIETVLFAIPDPTPPALARLAKVAELAKWGTAWQDQPRVPAGQPGGGQWTDKDDAAEPASGESPKEPASSQEPKLPIDDGVYRPATDAPQVISTGGAEEDAESWPSNGSPKDFTRLEDVFPDLANKPGASALLAPVDGFLGVSALADEANLEATLYQYGKLVAEIKQIDPRFVDDELLPPGGIAGLSWQARTNLIDDLLMKRAAAYYNIFENAGPLQVETLRFLQKAVDNTYDEAVSAADAGRLQPRLSREEAIGNRIDLIVRADLKDMFNEYDIPFGARTAVTVNNRDYQTSDGVQTYWIPDARIRDVSYDWTLSLKTVSSPQIRGFFSTDSWVRAVVIIRPSQLGGDYTYLIPRAAGMPN